VIKIHLQSEYEMQAIIDYLCKISIPRTIDGQKIPIEVIYGYWYASTNDWSYYRNIAQCELLELSARDTAHETFLALKYTAR